MLRTNALLVPKANTGYCLVYPLHFQNLPPPKKGYETQAIPGNSARHHVTWPPAPRWERGRFCPARAGQGYGWSSPHVPPQGTRLLPGDKPPAKLPPPQRASFWCHLLLVVPSIILLYWALAAPHVTVSCTSTWLKKWKHASWTDP